MKKLPQFETNIALSLSTWVEILKAFNKIRNLEIGFIESHGLTIGQFGLLELLHHRGEQTIGAATKLVFSTPGNMTVVIKNLIKLELIASEKHENDKRATVLRITTKGSELIASIFPQHSENIESFMSGLSSDEKEEVRTLLRKLNKSLR